MAPVFFVRAFEVILVLPDYLELLSVSPVGHGIDLSFVLPIVAAAAYELVSH